MNYYCRDKNCGYKVEAKLKNLFKAVLAGKPGCLRCNGKMGSYIGAYAW